MSRKADTNGIQTAFTLEGKAGAPVVILSHGLAADRSMWAPQIEALSRSYTLLSYDIRGHGDSGASAGDYSLRLLAQDVLALMDALGIARAHYVGLSLGGMVGQYLGAWHGERLSSLTLCATTSDAPKASWAARVHEVRARGVEQMADATIDRWVTPAFKSLHPEMMTMLRAMVLRTSLDGYAGSAAAIRDMELACGAWTDRAADARRRGRGRHVDAIAGARGHCPCDSRRATAEDSRRGAYADDGVAGVVQRGARTVSAREFARAAGGAAGRASVAGLMPPGREARP